MRVEGFAAIMRASPHRLPLPCGEGGVGHKHVPATGHGRRVRGPPPRLPPPSPQGGGAHWHGRAPRHPPLAKRAVEGRPKGGGGAAANAAFALGSIVPGRGCHATSHVLSIVMAGPDPATQPDAPREPRVRRGRPVRTTSRPAWRSPPRRRPHPRRTVKGPAGWPGLTPGHDGGGFCGQGTDRLSPTTGLLRRQAGVHPRGRPTTEAVAARHRDGYRSSPVGHRG